MLLGSDEDSGSVNFSERSDSDIDHAQEENWNETDEVVKGDVDGNVVVHGSDAQWIWRAVQTSYRGQKNFIYWTVWASEKC
jgi:hypothetical protein